MKHSATMVRWGLPWRSAACRVTAIFVPLLAAGCLTVAAGGPPAAPPAGPAATPPAAGADPAPAGLTGREWTTVRTHRKIVALTFDAGADADGVRSILHTLSQNHVPATFFLTGDFTRNYPGVSRSIASAGMRIGDHSITHPHFTKLTDAQMRAQVLGAQQRIETATGANPWPWFRFPYGDRNAHTISVVNGVGFIPIGWTVDTLGWEGTSGGITVSKVVSRVLSNARPGEIVLMHCGSNPKDHSTLDADALPAVIAGLRKLGYSFVTLDAMLGYRVVTAGGAVHAFGAASFGSLGTRPAGVTAVAIADDHATGGYWILKSNGGVRNSGAPWRGSLAGRLPPGVRATAIAAGADGGYYVLTSDGGVHAFGAASAGSDLGKLPQGVTAVGLAVDRATGGYWLLRSDGGVDNFGAPALGSLTGKVPAGARVTAIAAGAAGGYYVLTSDGGVHAFGAPLLGSQLGRLPAGVTAVGMAADLATGGYWLLRSDGAVVGYHAPWWGSLSPGRSVRGIAGQ